MTEHTVMKGLAAYTARHGRAACAALLALGLMAGHAMAEPKRVPKPHSYKLTNPPANVAAGDYKALLGGAVFVGFAGGIDNMPEHPRDIIEVTWMGRDGRYASCRFGQPGRHNLLNGARWKMRRYRKGNRQGPTFVNGRDISGNKGGILIPVYNARTGGMKWYHLYRKRWVGFRHGHLQKRLPRAVWTACPNFPSAKSLGVGVNDKQTAITYFDLVKQDRGQRILRPDLVTRDPIEYLNKKTGKWELRKKGRRHNSGSRNSFGDR